MSFYEAPITPVSLEGPRRVTCSVCFAKVGYPCTQPTNDSRRDVTWFHSRREQDATRF